MCIAGSFSNFICQFKPKLEIENKRMKKVTSVLSILTAGLIAVPAIAQTGCCGTSMGAMAGCSEMSSHDSHDAQPVADNKMPQQVAAVFDNYIQIQTALAKDSVDGVAQKAQAIASAIKDDAMTTFATNIVQQAEDVAKGTDLRGVREAFKPLSQSLIDYLSKYPALATSYRQVHCPMADANWLQTESVVNNPYFGKSMLHCGQFVTTAADKGQGHQDHSMHMQ